MIRQRPDACAALGGTGTASSASAPVPADRVLARAIRRSLWPRGRWHAALLAAGAAGISLSAAAGPFPPEVSLDALLPENGGDGSAGFVINGIRQNDRSGRALAIADLNGDGVDDLAIGARNAGGEYAPLTGQTYIVFGRGLNSFGAVFNLSQLLPEEGGDGTRGVVIRGIDPTDFSGRSLAVGDVNGDGRDDLVIGSIAAGPDPDEDGRGPGQAYVLYGKDEWPAIIRLITLLPDNGGTGALGAVMSGINQGDRAGYWVSTGDIDDDGIDDLIIGARSADPDGHASAGETYLVYGVDNVFPPLVPLTTLLPELGNDGSRGAIFEGIEAEDFSGRSVASGDINGDGIADLIIGARGADPFGKAMAGQTYVIFGGPELPARTPLASLLATNGGDGSSGFVINGIATGDWSSRVLTAGDVNGDGIDDVVIGAQQADPGNRTDAGEVYVVFGRAAPFPAAFELSALDAGAGGSEGVVFRGARGGDKLGRALNVADVNGDSIGDLLIGAYQANPDGKLDAGAAYLIYGRPDFPASFDVSRLLVAQGGDGSEGVVFNGAAEYDYAGFGVNGLGDINGDGINDVCIGAYGASPPGRGLAGRTFVIFGQEE